MAPLMKRKNTTYFYRPYISWTSEILWCTMNGARCMFHRLQIEIGRNDIRLTFYLMINSHGISECLSFCTCLHQTNDRGNDSFKYGTQFRDACYPSKLLTGFMEYFWKNVHIDTDSYFCDAANAKTLTCCHQQVFKVCHLWTAKQHLDAIYMQGHVRLAMNIQNCCWDKSWI